MTLAPDIRSCYKPLPPEPWGHRLSRARKQVAGLTLTEATALAGYFTMTSESAICRLESLADAPGMTGRDRSRRALAYVLCKAYEVDPAEFGLDDGDVPSGITIPPRSVDASSTIWYPPVRLAS